MSKSYAILSIFAGIFFFFLNNYVAPLPLGQFFSFGLGLFVILLTIYSVSSGMYSFLIISILSASENKKISISQNEDTANMAENYFTFFTSSIGPFNIYVWVLFSMAFISLIRLFLHAEKIKLGKSFNLLISTFLFLLVLIFGTLFDIPERLSIDYKYIISDVRPILIFLIGVIITIDIKNKKNWQYSPESFISLITFIAVALTVQFLFTLANDSYQGELYLSFVSSPHIMWPLFFTVVMSGNYLRNYIGIFSFFGAFKIARGEILNIGISLTMIIFYFYKLTSGVTKAHKLNIFKSMTGLILIIIFLLTYLKFWHPYIFDFIFFKFDFFISLALGEISSNSVLMRFVEFQNIMAFYISNTDALIWGRGLGSYFTFSEFPPVRALEINDFSISEISSGLFYKPHHFINFLLLKGGLIGLFLYIIFCLRFLVMGLKIVKHGNINEKILGYYLFFFSIYCLNMYWQPTLIIWALLIYSFGEVNLRSIENRYSNS